MKPQKQFHTTVEQQHPAINEVAQLVVVGRVFGSHDECWKQAKLLTWHPILTFTEDQNVAKH